MSLVIGGGASDITGIDGRSSRRSPTAAAARRDGRTLAAWTAGTRRPAARPAPTAGSAATAADEDRRAAARAAATSGRRRWRRAALRAAATGRTRRRRRRLLRPDHGSRRHRPRGRRLAGQRIFDAKPARRRHERGQAASDRRAGGATPAADVELRAPVRRPTPALSATGGAGSTCMPRRQRRRRSPRRSGSGDRRLSAGSRHVEHGRERLGDATSHRRSTRRVPAARRRPARPDRS